MLEQVLKFDFWDTTMSDAMQDKYLRYYELIHEYNKVMNLTGIDDLEGVYLKHFYDCLLVVDEIKKLNPTTIADVGSGAGFPGIVLAIYFNEITFTLIEPLGKRCKFLEIVVKELELDNVIIKNERVEDLDSEYDLVTSRAVANLTMLSEISYGITKLNGHMLFLKGQKCQEEVKAAHNALKVLGLTVVDIQNVTLPIENSSRSNILLKKVRSNKDYPRHFSMIKKKPL